MSVDNAQLPPAHLRSYDPAHTAAGVRKRLLALPPKARLLTADLWMKQARASVEAISLERGRALLALKDEGWRDAELAELLGWGVQSVRNAASATRSKLDDTED